MENEAGVVTEHRGTVLLFRPTADHRLVLDVNGKEKGMVVGFDLGRDMYSVHKDANGEECAFCGVGLYPAEHYSPYPAPGVMYCPTMCDWWNVRWIGRVDEKGKTICWWSKNPAEITPETP